MVRRSKKIEIGKSMVKLYDGRVGIVKYEGKVKWSKETKERWYGLDFINAKGLHDGEHEGKRYFKGKKGQCDYVRSVKVEEVLKKKPDQEDLDDWARMYQFRNAIFEVENCQKSFTHREVLDMVYELEPIENWANEQKLFPKPTEEEKKKEKKKKGEKKKKFHMNILVGLIGFVKLGWSALGIFQLGHGKVRVKPDGTWNMEDRKG
eukprot:UN34797